MAIYQIRGHFPGVFPQTAIVRGEAPFFIDPAVQKGSRTNHKNHVHQGVV